MPLSGRKEVQVMALAPPLSALLAAPDALQRVAGYAAQMLDVPVALISLLGEARAFAAGSEGEGEGWRARREAPLARTLCQYAVAAGRPLLIDDAREHPLVRENPVAWLGEVAYAGVPIRGVDGAVRGSLCAIDARPRAWTDGDARTLADLALFASLALERVVPHEAPALGPQAPAPRPPSLRMLQKAVETMQMGVTITDPEGRILYSNPADARMHGYRQDELVGRHARIFAPPEHARPLNEDGMEGVTSWSRETVNVRKDGTLFPVFLRSDVVKDHRGRVVGLVTCCEDITQRKQLEKQLLHNSFYDSLTGLPNRGLLEHRLELAIDRARRGDGAFAMLVVGLDRFKLVNESLGRGAGDELLVRVAERLRACVRGETLVARLAGDEFALLIDHIEGLADATRVAACLRDQLSLPFRVGDSEVFTGASIGITLSYTAYEQPEEVLRDAVIAMNRSKGSPQGQYEVFDRDMHARAMERLRTETDLRRALERGELRVHYQPIVTLETGRIAGFEALARWQHPERGLVLPDDFIPLAEETGLILPIGIWVLEEACRSLRRWQDARPAGEAPLTMAVNLSAKQFAQPELADQVERVLRATGLKPASLKLEITESVIMQHTEVVTHTMRRLKALGVQLHIDDFGTGYSSLAYLHRLPLDGLKIDRSFVTPGAGAESLQLVRTIVAMAHALGVAVVTEGVETAELVSELRGLKCEYGQGYFFSRPLEGAAVEALFEAEPRW